MLDPQTFQERAAFIIAVMAMFTGINSTMIIIILRYIKRQEKK